MIPYGGLIWRLGTTHMDHDIHSKMLQRKVQYFSFYDGMVLKLHPSVPLLNMVSISHMQDKESLHKSYVMMWVTM